LPADWAKQADDAANSASENRVFIGEFLKFVAAYG
jgi:hypothetical protein